MTENKDPMEGIAICKQCNAKLWSFDKEFEDQPDVILLNCPYSCNGKAND